MSNFLSDAYPALLIALGLAVAIVVMILLARWARRRSKGAVVTGALLSAFAPDPTFESNIRLAGQAGQVQTEEDREGEGKDPLTRKNRQA